MRLLALAAFVFCLAACKDDASDGNVPLQCFEGTDGEVCELHCDTPDCIAVCPSGKRCLTFCPYGNCTERCAEGATCELSCAGGNCDQRCDQGSTCTSTCDGGACQQSCSGSSCQATPGCAGGVCTCTGASCGDAPPLPTTFVATGIAWITDQVVENQDTARTEGAEFVAAGQIQLGDQIVQLTPIDPDPCPHSALHCDTTEATELGIGSSALVAPIASERMRVRNQGRRGTCAAFAITGGVETLLARGGATADLSEQATYWIGHSIQGNFQAPGLFPHVVVRGLAVGRHALEYEERWPYNASLTCERYTESHPTQTCTDTETQGGGDDGSEEPWELTSARGPRIASFRTVYASLGRLKLALYQGNPVVLSITANLDFSRATRYHGVVAHVLGAPCTGPCGHAILAIGFVDDPRVGGGGYVIIRNSWGAGWGDHGLAYLTYEWLEHNFRSATAITGVTPFEP